MVGKLAWGVGRQRLSAGVYPSVTHNPRGLGFSFGTSAPFFLFKYIQLLYLLDNKDWMQTKNISKF